MEIGSALANMQHTWSKALSAHAAGSPTRQQEHFLHTSTERLASFILGHDQFLFLHSFAHMSSDFRKESDKAINKSCGGMVNVKRYHFLVKCLCFFFPTSSFFPCPRVRPVCATPDAQKAALTSMPFKYLGRNFQLQDLPQ